MLVCLIDLTVLCQMNKWPHHTIGVTFYNLATFHDKLKLNDIQGIQICHNCVCLVKRRRAVVFLFWLIVAKHKFT